MKSHSQESLSMKPKDDVVDKKEPPKGSPSRGPHSPSIWSFGHGGSLPQPPSYQLSHQPNKTTGWAASGPHRDEARWTPLADRRPDRQTRWTTLALISDVMRNDQLTPAEIVDILIDLEEACKKDSVPFSELLHEDVDGAGASPLLLEIIRGNWRQAPELVEYLIHNTKGPKVSWMVRQGCRVTGDNELFQCLRKALDEKPSYAVTLREQASEFSATLDIEDLAGELAQSQRYVKQVEEQTLSMDYRRNKAIEMEWVVGGRVWSLEVSEDMLSLTLIEGAGCIVTASVIIIAEKPEDSNSKESITSFFEVAFPPLSEIRPLTGEGVHRISSTIPWETPSFPGSFYKLIAGTPLINFIVNAQVLEAGTGSSKDGQFYETSELDEVGWEDVSTLAPENEEKWVLASWQGRDQDAP